MSKFAHLHCHTEYSLMDGLIHIKDLCIRSKEFGMDACAITDHGNMYGAAKFYKSCKDYELKPIIGCEVYVYQDYQNSESYSAKQCNHLILLSQTLQGYHNLTKLVSRSYLDVIDGKPRVKKEKLRQYQEGLICLSGCIKGEIPEAIFANDMDRARRLAEEYHYIFPDRFYLELESNGLKEQEIVNNGLLDLAKTFSLPIVATNNCHYLDKSDYTAHEVLLCIGENKRLKDQNRLSYATNEFYLKSPEEMEKAFYDLPEAIDNTLRIADSCNVDLDLGQHCFPVYRLSEGTNSENELSKLAKEGLKQRFENHPNHEKLNEEIYWKRLQYEIDVILGMGFSQYFLVTHEVVNWAKKHGIPVGPGHGLVTGSLVAWAMQLTDIDPIHYHLFLDR